MIRGQWTVIEDCSIFHNKDLMIWEIEYEDNRFIFYHNEFGELEFEQA